MDKSDIPDLAKVFRPVFLFSLSCALLLLLLPFPGLFASNAFISVFPLFLIAFPSSHFSLFSIVEEVKKSRL